MSALLLQRGWLGLAGMVAVTLVLVNIAVLS
jgi:hypothetical protein